MLYDRWSKLCGKFDLAADEQWDLFQNAYGQASRLYHNLTHIEDCIAQLDENVTQNVDSDAVEFAIWFHDVVYDSRAADNEEKSAQLATQFLKDVSIAGKVASLVRVTSHRVTPNSPDEALICDIDLSILGRPPAQYERYAHAIRQEYYWVSSEDYCSGRLRVLNNFLEREYLYFLESFRDKLEMSARTNLQAEIDRLSP